MKASPKQYAQALLELTRGQSGAKLSGTIRDFAAVISHDNQISRLDRIISAFRSLWNQENSCLEADIISAHKLGDKEVKILQDYIKDKSGATTVNIATQIDAGLLGGVVIKYGDQIFDAGLKTKLTVLRRSIQISK